MKKIDFQNFTLPLDVAGKRKRAGDARESFANTIYQNASGIRAHALALKIFKSKGPTEYDDGECALIKAVAEKYGVPAFIDGLRSQMEDEA